MKGFRRIVVILVIGSFSVAALLGIIALLGGGELGETEGKVLLTTVIVGVESIAVLCYLAVAMYGMVIFFAHVPVPTPVRWAMFAVVLWAIAEDFNQKLHPELQQPRH